eukprot:gb/GEZN01000860.1/.p1 GENE.gb/GEZN01000860.1/~~gb/GEZN01000860.1/.p1  ORF type:complete len:1165 (+),score=105.80 gb/GEZN01000860.1/:30-3524(+)
MSWTPMLELANSSNVSGALNSSGSIPSSPSQVQVQLLELAHPSDASVTQDSSESTPASPPQVSSVPFSDPGALWEKKDTLRVAISSTLGERYQKFKDLVSKSSNVYSPWFGTALSIETLAQEFPEFGIGDENETLLLVHPACSSCDHRSCSKCQQFHFNKCFFVNLPTAEGSYLCAHGFLSLSLLHVLRHEQNISTIRAWVLDAFYVFLQTINNSWELGDDFEAKPGEGLILDKPEFEFLLHESGLNEVTAQPLNQYFFALSLADLENPQAEGDALAMSQMVSKKKIAFDEFLQKWLYLGLGLRRQTVQQHDTKLSDASLDADPEAQVEDVPLLQLQAEDMLRDTWLGLHLYIKDSRYASQRKVAVSIAHSVFLYQLLLYLAVTPMGPMLYVRLRESFSVKSFSAKTFLTILQGLYVFITVAGGWYPVFLLAYYLVMGLDPYVYITSRVPLLLPFLALLFLSVVTALVDATKYSRHPIFCHKTPIFLIVEGQLSPDITNLYQLVMAEKFLSEKNSSVIVPRNLCQPRYIFCIIISFLLLTFGFSWLFVAGLELVESYFLDEVFTVVLIDRNVFMGFGAASLSQCSTFCLCPLASLVIRGDGLRYFYNQLGNNFSSRTVQLLSCDTSGWQVFLAVETHKQPIVDVFCSDFCHQQDFFVQESNWKICPTFPDSCTEGKVFGSRFFDLASSVCGSAAFLGLQVPDGGGASFRLTFHEAPAAQIDNSTNKSATAAQKMCTWVQGTPRLPASFVSAPVYNMSSDSEIFISLSDCAEIVQQRFPEATGARFVIIANGEEGICEAVMGYSTIVDTDSPYLSCFFQYAGNVSSVGGEQNGVRAEAVAGLASYFTVSAPFVPAITSDMKWMKADQSGISHQISPTYAQCFTCESSGGFLFLQMTTLASFIILLIYPIIMFLTYGFKTKLLETLNDLTAISFRSPSQHSSGISRTKLPQLHLNSFDNINAFLKWLSLTNDLTRFDAKVVVGALSYLVLVTIGLVILFVWAALFADYSINSSGLIKIVSVALPFYLIGSMIMLWKVASYNETQVGLAERIRGFSLDADLMRRDSEAQTRGRRSLAFMPASSPGTLHSPLGAESPPVLPRFSAPAPFSRQAIEEINVMQEKAANYIEKSRDGIYVLGVYANYNSIKPILPILFTVLWSGLSLWFQN